jgi:hypothetical protein
MFYKRGEVKLSEKSREIYDKLIDSDSDLNLIKREFDFSFIYDEIKDKYCLDDGRNSIDGILALKAIFVQKYCGLRDRQLERKAKYDIEIKHFLDIDVDDEAFDFTTIWKFKKMLGDEKVISIFNHILEQIKSKGIIKSFRRQAIDTIPILAAAALPSITCLIYQAIKGVCNSVSAEILQKIFAETELTTEKLNQYSKARPLFRSENDEKIKAFQNAAKIGFKVLDIVHNEKLTSEEINFLEEILQDNVIKQDDDDFQHKHTEHTKKSLVDKDATLGHKTKEDLVYGYKTGVSVTPEGIITSYKTTPMSYRDDEHLIPLIEMQEKNGTKCDEVDADSAFGFIHNYFDMEAKSVILHSPLRNFDPERLSVYDFKYDKEKHELTCANNITVKGRNSGALTFEFPIRKCRKDCQRKDMCPLSPSKRTTLNENHEVTRRAIARQRGDKEIDKQNREKGIKNFKRLVVENVFAFLEKLGVKITPAYSLNMTKVHVGLVITLSNMLKTVRKLRKKREEEKLRLQTQKKSNFEVARGFFAKILTGAT